MVLIPCHMKLSHMKRAAMSCYALLLVQVEHVKAERTALSVVDSPYIVMLYYSFQDTDFLYLVMEYLPGGDIMTLLIRKDILSEHETRFYIAETILALEQIHSKGYLHRCGNEHGAGLAVHVVDPAPLAACNTFAVMAVTAMIFVVVSHTAMQVKHAV
jgi:hypothetical protein